MNQKQKNSNKQNKRKGKKRTNASSTTREPARLSWPFWTSSSNSVPMSSRSYLNLIVLITRIWLCIPKNVATHWTIKSTHHPAAKWRVLPSWPRMKTSKPPSLLSSPTLRRKSNSESVFRWRGGGRPHQEERIASQACCAQFGQARTGTTI